MVFGSIGDLFFNDLSCFVHCLFEAVFLMIVSSFLGRSLNWANPKNLDFSLVFICYFALGSFRRRSIFRKMSDKFREHFCIDFSSVLGQFWKSWPPCGRPNRIK